MLLKLYRMSPQPASQCLPINQSNKTLKNWRPLYKPTRETSWKPTRAWVAKMNSSWGCLFLGGLESNPRQLCVGYPEEILWHILLLYFVSFWIVRIMLKLMNGELSELITFVIGVLGRDSRLSLSLFLIEQNKWNGMGE